MTENKDIKELREIVNKKLGDETSVLLNEAIKEMANDFFDIDQYSEDFIKSDGAEETRKTLNAILSIFRNPDKPINKEFKEELIKYIVSIQANFMIEAFRWHKNLTPNHLRNYAGQLNRVAELIDIISN